MFNGGLKPEVALTWQATPAGGRYTGLQVLVPYNTNALFIGPEKYGNYLEISLRDTSKTIEPLGEELNALIFNLQQALELLVQAARGGR